MGDTMKVVQINAVYEYSSTGRITMELDLALKNKGHESYVFCTNREDPENRIYCMGTQFSRKVHGFFSRLTGLQGYYSKAATKKMLERLNDIRPDVVHLGNLHGNYIHVNMLLDYLARNQISTVITLHDCWLFTGHCCHYIEDNCDRWQYGCGKCPAKHKWNKSWFFDRSAKVYKDRKDRFKKLNKLTVVGVSDWITNECRKSFMKENASFCRIYNWIDLNTFVPPKRKQKNCRPKILSVSQGWSDSKGLSDILKIAKKNKDCDFVMVGDMPRDCNIPSNIKVVGTINDVNELVKYYQKADIFLHLSYQETFGKVIAEALACGIPAVVYNVTAMPELIGPGCGIIVPKGDWKSAGKAVRELLTTRKYKQKVDMRNFSEKSFDKKKMIMKKADIVTKAAQDKGEILDMCRSYAMDQFDKEKLLYQWMELYKSMMD